MTRWTWNVVTAIAGILALPPISPGLAQGPAAVETMNVDLVNLEVWVTDGRGATLRGLERGDFRVYEDGQEIPLTHFAFLPSGLPVSAGAPSPERPGAQPEAALPSGRSVAVFLDEAHTGVGRRNEALTRLADGLEAGFGPRDRVSVLRFDGGLKVLLSWTGDVKKARRAMLEAGGLSTRKILAAQERRDIVDRLRADAGADEAGIISSGPCLHAGALANEYAESQTRWARSSLAAVGQALGAFAGREGRKALVLVSEDLRIQPGADILQLAIDLCSGQGAQEGVAKIDTDQMGDVRYHRFDPDSAVFDMLRYDLSDEWELLGARANALGVTIHALQIPRLDDAADVATSGPAVTAGVAMETRTGAQAAPALLSDRTGGRFLVQVGADGAQAVALTSGLDDVYLIGYVPPRGGQTARPRQVRVEVARPGAHLRYRKSYRMRSPDEELADRLLAHLLYGGGENALGAKITWEEATAGAAGGAARRSSAVRITVPLRELTFLEKEPGGEERGGVFSVALVERDATGRTSAVRRATIPVSASRGDVAQKSFTYEVAMSLAEGDHEIAVAVRDDLSGRVGLTKQTVRSRGSIASTGSGL